jgi:hypothetical protein
MSKHTTVAPFAKKTFSSLFFEMVQKVKILTTEDPYAQNGKHDAIHAEIIAFIAKLSQTQESHLSRKAAEYIALDSCSLKSEEFDLDYCIMAVYIMLFTNEELAYKSPVCTLEDPLDLGEIEVFYWDSLTGNSNEWFAKEFWKYGVTMDVEHYFLLRINHVETTDVEVYALYTTDDKSTVDEATERYAQAFLGGSANPDDNCYEHDSTKQYPLEALLIDEDEYRTFSRLSIRKYKSLENIPADDEEVSQMID